MTTRLSDSQNMRAPIALQPMGAAASYSNQELKASDGLQNDGPPTVLYRYAWYSAGFADYRRQFIKTYVYSIILNLVMIWASLSLVYGAYYKNNYLGKLKVFVVDLDGDVLGNQIVSAFEASMQESNHLDLIFSNAFTTAQEVENAVYDEQAWGAVVVNRGATENLRLAQANGNSSYDPTGAIEVVSEGARNPLASNSHTVPAILAILEPAVAAAGTNASASFVSLNANDANALHTALGCPQCFSPAYSYTPNDLRPADNATAFGAVLSGVIALIVFTFAVAGTSQQIGVRMGQHLNITSTIAWRFFGCMVAYFFTALSITGVQASFGMFSTSPYGSRAFMILWMLNWMTLSACGLSLEAILTSFGFYITNWFLNFWVFWHSAAAPYAAETMPGFYKYDYGFPLLHAIQGTNTIVYGTKSHLGRNFGVLVGWVVGSTILMAMATTARLQWNKRKGVHVIP